MRSQSPAPCVDCGERRVVTHPIRQRVGKRVIDETVCGRCYLRRQEEG